MIKAPKYTEKDDLSLKNKLPFYLSSKDLIIKMHFSYCFCYLRRDLLNPSLGIYQKRSGPKTKENLGVGRSKSENKSNCVPLGE